MITLLSLFGRFGAIVRTALVVLASFALWQVYSAIAPTRPQYTARQMRLVNALSYEAAQWASTLELDRDRTVFGIFQRDPFGTVSMPVREAVFRADVFDLIDRMFSEKLLDRVCWTLPMFQPDEELLALGHKCDARYALGGIVERFQDDGAKSRLDLRIVIWDVRKSSKIVEKEFQISDSSGWMNPQKTRSSIIESISITQRLFGWMVLTALLPFLAVIRRSILIESQNEVRVTILLSLIFLSGLGAYFLVVCDLEPFSSGAFMLCLVPLSGIYHWKALSFLRENLQ
jgi:hypothetical protein